MSRPRRRSSTGILSGVIIALLVAVFALRLTRALEPVAPPARTAPVRVPSRPDGRAEAVARAAEPTARAGSSAKGFASRQRLEEHFEKHGDEFPGLTMAGYLAAAQRLRDAAVGGEVREIRRRDGVVTRFDRASGAFLAVNRDGTIRTFFRPNDGEAYFSRQASRRPGDGP